MSFSFGSSSTAGANTGGFSFGAPQSKPAASTGFSFGNTSTTTTPAAITNTGFSFGQTKPAVASTGFSFGQPSSTGGGGGGLFNTAGLQNNTTTQFAGVASAKPNPNDPMQQAKLIHEANDTNSPNCRFQFIVYNKVRPEHVKNYVKPPNVNPRLWEQALRHNPDPTTMVPLQLVGFADLKKRVKVQQMARDSLKKQLDELSARVNEMELEHTVTTKTKITEYKRKHVDLAHRLLALMHEIELKLARGTAFSANESLFERQLINSQRELHEPTQFHARVDELSSVVRMQPQQRLIGDCHLSGPGAQANLAKIFNFLSEQKKALATLVKEAKTQREDVDIVRKGIEQARASLYQNTLYP